MKRVTVMLCCNDEHGTQNTLTGLVIEATDGVNNILEIESDDADNEVVVRFEEPNRVRIGRRVYQHHGHGSMVGNVFWESIVVPPGTAARIVNYVLGIEWNYPGYLYWTQAAESDLFEKASRRQRLTAADISRLVRG